ncbi:hypothetical protein ABZK66_001774 [Campylobacter coli]|uniref:hypothetical protein n=1 Tax=Campylobacter coli TaxID=195 RepID=UPI0006994EF4|nr:hypothetical protein [Campylobacter coli]HEB8436995.1 hypothetical protein [Campylobacter jejuni]EAI9601830.1 hypothetical protein [Campylobacter coli]EAJ9253629.1 hypothetical protein [Campylobacter coli]EAL9963216.1 hypothetical protein [Campylobacter coli]EDO6931368.1 hypothetical protein [Campylobacter coli]
MKFIIIISLILNLLFADATNSINKINQNTIELDQINKKENIEINKYLILNKDILLEIKYKAFLILKKNNLIKNYIHIKSQKELK